MIAANHAAAGASEMAKLASIENARSLACAQVRISRHNGKAAHEAILSM